MPDTLVVPTDPDELEEWANDPVKMAQVGADPGGMATFTARYARNAFKRDPDLIRQIEDEAKNQVKAVMDGQMSDLSTTAREEVQRELLHQLRHGEAGNQATRLPM